eukprot:GHVL01010522.1.p1 GENE.GHVL01010522.1~~GHVL01010522.1.p1  ORF type:complete len:306 (+),score=27.91 GHVL01010522.1:44-961(+)
MPASSELLAIVLDLNPQSWLVSRLLPESPSKLHFIDLWNCVLVYIKAFSALSKFKQQLLLILATNDKCEVLFCDNTIRLDCESLTLAVRDFFVNNVKAVGKGDCQMAAALSLAMCRINRSMKDGSARDFRILVLEACVAESFGDQYIALMNAVFSAQRLKVPIDVCVVGDFASKLLQQASALTKGIYADGRGCFNESIGQHHHHHHQPSEKSRRLALIPFLVFRFLRPVRVREQLRQPAETESSVDFGCFCVCHSHPVDIAWVCSSCLAVFCSNVGRICIVCKGRFRPLDLTRTAISGMALIRPH